MAFSVHRLYDQIFKLWRKKRFDRFLALVRPADGDTLLDVGGYPECWTIQPQPVGRIDTINPDVEPWDPKSAPEHNIRVLQGDGCALPMGDGSYDIVFSNSVIEHVGSWERQQRFAAETRRVGRALWVQTPAYECWIEPHYLTPFIHYLPKRVQKKIMRWFTVRGWLERLSQQWVDEMVECTRLLRRREFEQLFPDCEIITERMLWVIPKSYIAVRRKA